MWFADINLWEVKFDKSCKTFTIKFQEFCFQREWNSEIELEFIDESNYEEY
jgi:hypothetical protein